MISGANLVGWVTGLAFLVGLQPVAAQQSFPNYHDLAASNVELTLEGFVSTGGTLTTCRSFAPGWSAGRQPR